MRPWLVVVIVTGLAGTAVADGAMPVPEYDVMDDWLISHAEYLIQQEREVVDAEEAQRRLTELDNSVASNDLPTGGGWRKRARLRLGRGQLVNVYFFTSSGMSVSVSEAESWEGEHFSIRPYTDDPCCWNDPVPWNQGLADTTGPILFSVRLPVPGSTVPHQFVVYTRASSVFVVERELGAKRWQKLLRLDFRASTRFTAAIYSDPH